ncbi:unnamed protein product [Rhizophagus irregularis]|nr:unnamed protein product [Rhizophagus irregularis]CAB5379021.1 unnamed protein product [Rhizophagus irregularis]
MCDEESFQNLETASEVSTTLSDASSEKSITSKKSHWKGKAKLDNSAPPSTLLHMAEKRENRRVDSSMLVPDIEKLVNRCARLVAEC